MSRLPLTGAGPSAGYSAKVLRLSPIAYWPLWEATGSTAYDISGNGLNGTYTDATLGQTGIGDGNTCPLFDKTSFVDIYSAGLVAAFSAAAGTVSIWGKAFDVGVWSDAASRYFIQLRADANNRVRLVKNWVNDQVFYGYEAASADETDTQSTTSIAWMHVAMTWDKVAGEVYYYYNGTEFGPEVLAGTWVGNLAETTTCIGSDDTGLSNPFYGWLAHACVFDTALTSTQIASLVVV